MTTAMVKWTTGIVIGLSLFTTGCGEKKSEVDTSQSQVGVAPGSPPEKSATDNTLAPGGGPDQSPSGAKTEQNTGGERKSPRG
jgi:hypothetical protein